MKTREEIEKMTPIEAYNQAVNDCLGSAKIICHGDEATMGFVNASPRDIKFFSVDKESILKNLIEA